MNIKITHSWLLEYLNTDATPEEIRKYLSLSGPSIESVTKKGEDYIYNIEIISNRIDTASVLGIAQEATAILPMFGKSAKLKFDPLKKYKFDQYQGDLDLKVKIASPNLCPRFTAIILDGIKIKPSPDFIRNRVIASGIKSINNVVDISNYLMLTLGQPVHTFDYDQIKEGEMFMREAKKGEKIVTLDGKEVVLPGGDIVVEDGSGRLIDLCGIMGGANSAISEKTKRVLLFVQTYNKEKIRKTTMTTGVRTEAATFFEKGLDEERVESTTVLGIELLQKYAGGKIDSKLYDIYEKPYIAKKVEIADYKFEKSIGIKIDKKIIVRILNNLGFGVEEKKDSLLTTVPSYRKYDISIAEDLVEEVSRVYGYHKLPNDLPPSAYIKQPEEFEKLFSITSKIKYFLKHLGLNEVINYSMISKKMLEEWKLNTKEHLRLSNTISEEIEYMRSSLLPSLSKNLADNAGKRNVLKFFEIGKVYLPKKGDLPLEIYRLGLAVNTSYFDLKGIVEAVMREFNIKEKIDYKVKEKNHAFLCEIDFNMLIDNARLLPDYEPINPYSVIKLDKTFAISNTRTYKTLHEAAFKSKLLKRIEVVSLYKNKLSLRFYYSSTEKNITEEEALRELVSLV